MNNLYCSDAITLLNGNYSAFKIIQKQNNGTKARVKYCKMWQSKNKEKEKRYFLTEKHPLREPKGI